MGYGYVIDTKNRTVTLSIWGLSSEDRWGVKYEGGGIKIVCPFPEKAMTLKDYLEQVMVEPIPIRYFEPGSTIELATEFKDRTLKPGSRFEFWGLPIISKFKRKERGRD